MNWLIDGINVAGSMVAELLVAARLRRPVPVRGAWQPVQEVEPGPDDSLLRRARLVARGVPGTLAGHYWWLSGTEVLLMRMAAGRPSYELAVLDSTTGSAPPLEAFHARNGDRLTGNPMYVMCQGELGTQRELPPPHCDLSPDGQWLLWNDPRGGWAAATLDGLQSREWPGPRHVSPPGHWLDPGTSWVELVHTLRRDHYMIEAVRVRSVDGGQETTVKIETLPAGLVLGLSGPRRILQRELAEAPDGSLPFAEVLIEDEQATVQRFNVKPPSSGQAMEVALSPDGKLLAWVIGEFGDNGFFQGFRLWITGVSGQEAREIGYARLRTTEPPPGSQRECYHWPQQVRWLSSGTEVSFVLIGCLYVVEVGSGQSPVR